MINSLSGKVTDVVNNEITLEVAGVGYQVFLPLRIAVDCSPNDSLNLYIYTHVREDVLQLYGFTEKEDKHIFTQLLSVSGVGAKTALSILSKAKTSDIATAIRSADVEFFTQIPGIGKKSSQRIIVDLKSKLGTTKELDLAGSESDQFLQVQLALKSLGFSAQEAKEAITKIENKDTLSESELIRQALKSLGK